MAKIKHSHTKSVYITSVAPMSGSMTISALRDFLDACTAEGVPDNVTLTAHHNTDTRHFTHVSVCHTVDVVSAEGTEISEDVSLSLDEPPGASTPVVG